MTTPSMPPPLPTQPSTQVTSKLAIWSLVLGVLSFCAVCITGVPAIILGILALVKINKSPAAIKGQGLAVAGLVTGVIGTLWTSIMVAMLLPAVAEGRAAAHRAVCLNNTRQLMVASLQYADAHGNTLPETLDQLKPYLGSGKWEDISKIFTCPAATDPGRPSYEIVAPGKKLTAVVDPSKTVFLREIQPHPRGRRAVGYMDGHVEMVQDP